MSLIRCKAASCAHNSDGKCVGGNIAVCCCGEDCSPACCASYTSMRKKLSTLKVEIGAMDGVNNTDTVINCQAAGCVHNKDDRCNAISINVTRPQRSQGGKCFCDSFDPRA